MTKYTYLPTCLPIRLNIHTTIILKQLQTSVFKEDRDLLITAYFSIKGNPM